MKGILKGIIFTLLMSAMFISVGALISLGAQNSDMIVKIFLWGGLCLCVFLGALLVSAGANEKRALKGILTALLSILIFVISAAVICKTLFCAPLVALCVCMAVCGAIGSFAGTQK